MTTKRFMIQKHKEEGKCFYCDTTIEKGETDLIIYRKGKSQFDYVQLHLTCIEPFIRELRRDVKKFIINQLK